MRECHETMSRLWRCIVLGYVFECKSTWPAFAKAGLYVSGGCLRGVRSNGGG